ncbi:MAG: RagB/SusD family nutrient uptake outer membrane protein [Marinifilaceae bacterium]
MDKYYNIMSKAAIVFIILITSGCNAWLDLDPENNQTSATYWNTKEDVEAVINNGYTLMKSCLEKYIQWGEVRGDGMMLDAKATSDEQKIVELQILTTNGICNWAPFYKVIASANAVIKYGPTVLEKDKSFKLELSNAYVAEAMFQRALCYFYLVRTFGEVPLVLEPYVDDSAPFMVKKNSEAEILNQILSDLDWAKTRIKPGYGNDIKNKGRATSYALHALLADVCLWAEKYEAAIESCDFIIGSGLYSLLDKEEWYNLYNPGNSVESIFELQWLGDAQQNSLVTWFNTSSRYILSQASLKLFTTYKETDYRGKEVTYLEDLKIWKYVGTRAKVDGGEVRPTSFRNANWIFYRLAEIHLMKAEALVMLGKTDVAYPILKSIRERAGYSSHPVFTGEKRQALELIMAERQMEFVAEGKRWFDILRTAKRNGYEYRDYLLDVLLENTSAQNRPIFESKLQNELGYYLPIHKNEIEANGGILVQNEYYNDVD